MAAGATDAEGGGRTADRRRGPALRVVAAAAAVLALLALGLGALVGTAGGPLLRPALEAKLGRPVSWAHLSTSRAPGGLRLVFTDLRVGQPASFGPGDLARVPRAEFVVRLAPLLAGRLEAPEVRLDRPLLHLIRRGPGDNNYTFGKGGGASGLLGATRTLVIAGGHVDMDDPQRRLALHAALSHNAAGPLPLALKGGGVLQGEPFAVDAHGGALNRRKPHAPHPVRVEMQDGAVRLRMAGSTQAPFDFRGLDMDVAGEGPNLADLAYLFNLLAPNSPAFRLTGHMHREGRRFDLTRLDARIGDSDLRGAIRTEHLQRRRIDATLEAGRITARDLKIMLASPPGHALTRSTPGVPGHGGGAGAGGKGQLLSSTPISLKRLDKVDAVLRLRAARADGFGPPVSDVDGVVSAVAGKLAFAPLRFRMAGGAVRVDYALETQARGAPASLDAKLDGLRLARAAAGGRFDGRLDATAKLKGAGLSLARQAATADGRFSLRVGPGALPLKAAAAVNGDVVGLIGGLLSPKAEAPLRCAAADFAVRDGIATATRLVVATDRGGARGGGRIDLRDQQVDLSLKVSGATRGRPLRLDVPITVTGPLAHPHVGGRAPSPAKGLGEVVKSALGVRPASAAAPPPAC